MDFCLQNGIFVYKRGISLTKRDSHLQNVSSRFTNGSLGLQFTVCKAKEFCHFAKDKLQSYFLIFRFRPFSPSIVRAYVSHLYLYFSIYISPSIFCTRAPPSTALLKLLRPPRKSTTSLPGFLPPARLILHFPQPRPNMSH